MQVQFVTGDACAFAVFIQRKKSSCSSTEEKRGGTGSFRVDVEHKLFVWKVAGG